MLRRDDQRIAAVRPDPGADFPILDVTSLQRRAEVERGKLRTMVEYAYYPRCRRQFVLEYFGDQDWASRDRRCGACDNCDAVAHGRSTGLSDAEQRAIRSLLLLVGALGGRLGRTRVTDLATGALNEPRFEDLPERGSLRGWTKAAVLDLLRALEGAGLIEASRGEYPTISTTRRGDQVATSTFDLSDLGIQMPTARSKSRKGKPRKR
jgi:ATP-dependent DNA helicase RecQ